VTAQIIRIDQALRRSAERQSLVRAYVTAQLDAESAEAFELRLMEDSELMDEVEIEHQLREGMKGLAAADSMQVPPSVGPTSVPAQRRWANIAAGFIGGALSLYLVQHAWTDAAVPQLGAAQIVEVAALRGAPVQSLAPLRVEPRADAEFLVVQWPLPRNYEALRAQVSTSASTQIAVVSIDEEASTATVLVALGESGPERIDLQCRQGTLWQSCDRPVAVTAR